MPRIICFDDDKDCLTILVNFLKMGQHEAVPLLRADQIVEAVNELKPDLIITDLMMPGISGGVVYHTIRKEFGPYLPIIVSSGSNLRLKLPDDPLLDYCRKPVDLEHLLVTVDRLLADSEAKKKEDGK